MVEAQVAGLMKMPVGFVNICRLGQGFIEVGDEVVDFAFNCPF
jgi:hypothetical protein